MHVAGLGGHLSGSRDLHVSRATVDRFPVRRLHQVVTFVRREQSRLRANLDVLHSSRLRNLLWWIPLARGIHDIDPDRQLDFAPECSAVNSLRLIESSPDRASD